jgi:hypothetical protein
VLCDARFSHLPQPEPALLRAASSDLARAGSGMAGPLPTPVLMTPAPSGQLPQQQRAVLDAHLPFLRCDSFTRCTDVLTRKPDGPFIFKLTHCGNKNHTVIVS